MLSRLLCPLLWSLLLLGVAAAQQEPTPRAVPTSGRPLVRTFDSDTHRFGELCQDVVVDRDGRVWIAGDDPLVFDGVRWLRAPRPWIGPVLSLGLDERGQVWTGSANQIGRIRFGPLRVEKMTDRLPDSDVGRLLRGVTHAAGVVFSSDSHAVQCSGEEVHAWAAPGGLQEVYLAGGQPHALTLTGRHFRWRQGAVWEEVAAPGRQRWNLSGPVAISARAEAWLAQHPPLSAARLADGRLAIGLRYNGVLVLGADGEIEEHFTVDDGLADNDCPALAVDAQGGLWIPHRKVATVSRLALGRATRQLGRAEGLLDIVYLPARRGPDLLVAGANAHWRRNPQNGRFAALPGTRGGGWHLLEFQGGQWWPGRSAGRPVGEGWEPIAPLAGLSVRAWCHDAAEPGAIYVGTDRGIFRLRRDNGVWGEPEFVFRDGQQSSWLGHFGDHWLWQAVNFGNIRRLDLRQPVAQREAQWLGEREGRPRQQAGDLLYPLAHEGRLVLATGGGFVAWRPEADRFEPLPEWNALLSPGERGVKFAGPTHDGAIWWQEGGERGRVRRLQREGGRWTAPEVSGGVLAGQGIDGGWDEPGRLWVASRHGLVAFSTTPTAASAAPLRAGVREVTGSDRAVLWQDGTGTAECVLPLGQRDLRLRYAATDFEGDLKGRSGLFFRTRLAGFDSWSSWTAEAQRDYTNLAPGRYAFEVEARTLAGEVVSGVPLTLLVPARWWETAAARTGFGSGGAALLVFVAGRWAQRRLRERVRRLNVEAALQEERLRIARDMHDGLGSTLGRLQLIVDRASRQDDADARGSSLAEASATARELAAHTRDIIWAVTPENDTLDNLLDRLAETVQAAAQAAGLRCRFDIPAESQPLPVHAATRHQILLAVKEAVHNAVKHARASELRLRATLHGASLAVEVADDGCGFDPAGGGRPGGLGLESLRARAEAVAGEAQIDSAPGRGTVVRFLFPLQA